MVPPVIRVHSGIQVVRDDLYGGGTKARFIRPMLEKHVADEFVYATPAQGGAQTALATVCAELGKRCTIFVAKRAEMHPRGKMAKRLGAQVIEVPHGYLTVVQSRAKAYCDLTGAALLPFGFDAPECIETIADSARSLDVCPDEVWCAGGSGVLSRALALAWPAAKRNVVQVGRTLSMLDVMGAAIHVYPRKFAQISLAVPPFPSDRHYDAKAWEMCGTLEQTRSVGPYVECYRGR